MAWRFVLASLNGSMYASLLRHWALTDSRPSASVTLIILRVADLAAALRKDHFDQPECVDLS